MLNTYVMFCSLAAESLERVREIPLRMAMGKDQYLSLSLVLREVWAQDLGERSDRSDENVEDGETMRGMKTNTGKERLSSLSLKAERERENK